MGDAAETEATGASRARRSGTARVCGSAMGGIGPSCVCAARSRRPAGSRWRRPGQRPAGGRTSSSSARRARSIEGRMAARPPDDEAGRDGLYGGRVERLGWLTRERKAGGRRAPSVLDWLVALALLAVVMLEVASGVSPGPVGVAAALEIAATLPVAFRRVAPLRAITAFGAAVFLPDVPVYGVGNSVANAATQFLLIYSVGRHTDRRGLAAGGRGLRRAADRRRIRVWRPARSGPSDWAAPPLSLAAGHWASGWRCESRYSGRSRWQWRPSAPGASRGSMAQERRATRNGRASRVSCTTWSPTTSGSSCSRPVARGACS